MRLYLSITRQERVRWAAPPPALLRKAGKLTIERAARWPLPPRLELSLLLTDDEGIQALNREYRGQDKPTDVLSFPQWEQADEPAWGAYQGDPAQAPAWPLGDIVISLPRAEAQAQNLGHSNTREAVFLFVHGLLHLLGYDHELGPAEEQQMFALQEQIISELELST